MDFSVDWIGATITVDNESPSVVVSLLEGKRTELIIPISTLMQTPSLVPMVEVRMLAGRGSCLGGLLPQVRPFVRMLWGSLTKPATKKKGSSVHETAPDSAQMVESRSGVRHWPFHQDSVLGRQAGSGSHVRCRWSPLMRGRLDMFRPPDNTQLTTPAAFLILCYDMDSRA